MAGAAARAPSPSRPPGEAGVPAEPSRSTTPPRLVLLERNLWQLGIDDLERTAAVLTHDELRTWFDGDREVLEAVALRTCQRVVLLALVRPARTVSALEERARRLGDWTALADVGAVRRVFRIAAGLDSRAPGEREIRDQVRRAASHVLTRNSRPVLRHLLRGAAQAAEDGPAERRPSVADLAVAWLDARLPAREPVLVLGAGTVGRRVAEGLAGSHPVVLLYRAHPPGREWARHHAIELRPTSELPEFLPRARAVVAAAKTTGRLLEAGDLPAPPAAGTRYFVDLGLPRNVDPRVATLPHTELVDLSGLPTEPVDADHLARWQARVDELAEVEAAEFSRVAAELAFSGPWRDAEGIRVDELSRALRHAGPVSPQARFAFEKLSERLVRRLLSGPVRAARERAETLGAPTRSRGRRSAPEPAPGP